MYQIVCKFIRFCTKQAIHLKKKKITWIFFFRAYLSKIDCLKSSVARR